MRQINIIIISRYLYVYMKGAHLWIRMLWSRWPCVAIITSASSSTNIVIFLGSMSLYLVHQSRTVPGVPMIICSCNLMPRSTEHRAEIYVVTQPTMATKWRIEIPFCCRSHQTSLWLQSHSYLCCPEWHTPVSHQDKISPFARLLDQSAERARMLAKCKDTGRTKQFFICEYISDYRLVNPGWRCWFHVMLTWVHLLAVFTWLSMAKEKAAVLPVPDCDWAIRFWGLRRKQKKNPNCINQTNLMNVKRVTYFGEYTLSTRALDKIDKTANWGFYT